MYRIGDEEDAEDRIFLQGFDRIEQQSQQRLNTELRRKRLTYGMAGAASVIALVIIVSLSVGLARKSSRPYTCKDEEGAVYDLTFFVIGDWGRQGNRNQRQVAKMMSNVAQCMAPAFIVSTGDNFYTHGLKSTSDENFVESFQDVYNDPALQVNWYAVLGNHDYGDGINPAENSGCAANTLEDCPEGCCYSPVWQFTGRLNDIRWHCSNATFNVPTGSSGLVDIIMMDTNPFITRYQKDTWYNNAGGIWQQDASEVKQQVRTRLAASQARWKLVVGHHPIASFGEHCQYAMKQDCEYMAWLEQEMRDANAAAYMCGHDHNLQYIYRLSDPEVPDSPPALPVFVVSGAGSDIRYGEFNKYRPKDGYTMSYMVDDQGFVAVRVNSTHMVMHYYAASHSEPVYTAVVPAPA